MKLLTVADVCARLSVSRSTLYRLQRTGRFVAPIRLVQSTSQPRWIDTEVEGWMLAERGAQAGRDS